MNVEAELIGCPVHYHAEVDGVPVYPTVGERRIERAEDFELPEDLTQGGRVAAVTDAIGRVRQQAAGRGAVGAFVPGPFTLAGQVLDPDRMFVTVLKKPEIMQAVLGKLTDLLIRVRNAYGAAGADFVVVEEGGAGSISPKSFQRLVLPQLKRLFEATAAPHVLHLAGHAERYVPFMLAAGADAIGVDQACDLDRVVGELPAGFPLSATCGAYDMLAAATPAEIQATVRACLDRGVTFAMPPADIYPPARPENIGAFVAAHRGYRKRERC
jgi:uroporphyrinogen-III decarboxylase